MYPLRTAFMVETSRENFSVYHYSPYHSCNRLLQLFWYSSFLSISCPRDKNEENKLSLISSKRNYQKLHSYKPSTKSRISDMIRKIAAQCQTWWLSLEHKNQFSKFLKILQRLTFKMLIQLLWLPITETPKSFLSFTLYQLKRFIGYYYLTLK